MQVGIVEHRPADRDLAQIGAFVAGDDAQSVGFHSRGAQDGGQRTGRHRQLEASEHRLVAEGLVQVGDDDIGGGRRHGDTVAFLGSRSK